MICIPGMEPCPHARRQCKMDITLEGCFGARARTHLPMLDGPESALAGPTFAAYADKDGHHDKDDDHKKSKKDPDKDKDNDKKKCKHGDKHKNGKYKHNCDSDHDFKK